MAKDLFPFSDLNLTIDTRERDQGRINRIKMYFENRGAEVQRKALQDFDYHVTGEYKEWPIDLGIEYKTINDIVSTWKELPERFARAVQHVDHLGLFIEGRITTHTHQDTGVIFVENSTADETGETMTYSTMMSKLLQWSMYSGLYVWNFQTVRDFGPSMENLLNHITNVPHSLLELPRKDVKRDRFAFYQNIPSIGGKAAFILSAHDLGYWISHQEELLQVMKPSKTQKILEFVGAGRIENAREQ